MRELHVGRLDVAAAEQVHEAEVLVGQRKQMVEALAGAQDIAAAGPVVVGPERGLPAAVGPFVADAAGGKAGLMVGAAGVFAELHAAFQFPQPRILAAEPAAAERGELEVVGAGRRC